jgi:hypothetical protein
MQRQIAAKEAADRTRLEGQVKYRTRQLRWVIVGLILLTFGLIYFAFLGSQQRQQAEVQKAAAQVAQKEAQATKELAEQRLNRIVSGIKYKQLALANDGTQKHPGLEQARPPADIVFRATAVDLHYKNNGKEIYQFYLGPHDMLGSDLRKRIAFITYNMNHTTFKNSLLVAGPDRKFTVSYTGWGCLTEVLAVIEYLDPDQPPQFVKFDMCANIEWQ